MNKSLLPTLRIWSRYVTHEQEIHTQKTRSWTKLNLSGAHVWPREKWTNHLTEMSLYSWVIQKSPGLNPYEHRWNEMVWQLCTRPPCLTSLMLSVAGWAQTSPHRHLHNLVESLIKRAEAVMVGGCWTSVYGHTVYESGVHILLTTYCSVYQHDHCV